MNKHIRFEALRQLLNNLGFAERTKNSTLIFEHTPSETHLFFHAYQPQEQVDLEKLYVVRKFLDEKGLMDRDAFEHWTWQQPTVQ